MNKILAFVVPVVLGLGLAVSAFVIVTALQGAPTLLHQPSSSGQVAMAGMVDQVAHGKELFVSKGCLVCHVNTRASVVREGLDMADVPNLTTVKLTPDYLKKWLHDPSAIKPGTQMPNLNLSDGEIDALVAFLVANNE